MSGGINVQFYHPADSRQTPSGLPSVPPPHRPLVQKGQGRFVYLGKVTDDPRGDKAVALWNEQEDALLAGLTPRPKNDGFTLRELLDRFIVSKKRLLDTGEIGTRYFAEMYATCRRIGDNFGPHRLVIDIGPDDFKNLRKAIAKARGPVRLMNEIQRTRSVFKFASSNGLIDKPVVFGDEFKKPSRKVLRLNRARNAVNNGKRMFDAAELRAIINVAGVPLKAMILLGVNCGFGPGADANLPAKAMNLKTG